MPCFKTDKILKLVDDFQNQGYIVKGSDKLEAKYIIEYISNTYESTYSKVEYDTEKESNAFRRFIESLRSNTKWYIKAIREDIIVSNDKLVSFIMAKINECFNLTQKS